MLQVISNWLATHFSAGAFYLYLQGFCLSFDISVGISKDRAAVPTSTSGSSFDQCFQANDCPAIVQVLGTYSVAEHLYHSSSSNLPNLLAAFVRYLCRNSDKY